MFCFSGKKTRWVHVNDLYKVSNSIPSAVYAFGLFEEEPHSLAWPFHSQGTYYIGMSGGKEESYVVDRKDKDKDKGRLETYVHKRMKEHSSSSYGKIKNSWVTEQLETTDKKLYICFILPPDSLEPDIVRNWLSTVESEQILTYHSIWKKLPELNLAERHTASNIDPNSFSQTYLKKIREVSLDKFY